MKSHSLPLLIAALLSLQTLALSADTNWPQFRGPGSQGLPAEGERLPVEWSAEKNIGWKTEVPGLGWSSPVVWGGKIFVTSAARVAGDEKPQMGLYLGKSRGEGEHRFLVLCYDFASGKKLWEREAHRGVPAREIHLKNSFASATAATDGQRVVALFHDVGLFAFDLDGKPLWNVTVKATKTRSDFGHGGSPVLHEGLVYLVDDNDDESFAAAYDAATGKELWRVKRERETNYATPFVWTVTQPAQLIVPATKRTIAYDLAGREIWSFTGGMSKLTIGTPFTAHGLLYLGSGYFQDPVRGLFVIKPGARGDITLRDGTTSSDAFAWSNPKIAPYNPTPLVFGDELYILYDQGMLACYDAKTGQPHYEKTRLGPAVGGFTASPWADDGKIFCLSERAETFVVRAGPQFELLGRNALEPEPCLACPALVGESIILRTASRLYSIRDSSAKPR
jgi:outer membrane protein assembly factor BamB